MKFSCSAKFLITLSFLLLAVALPSAVLFHQYYVTHIIYYDYSNIACIRNEQMEIYQYGNYWVLENFVGRELPRKFCHPYMKIGVALQGSYDSIYKLEKLYASELFATPSNFAVYIRDAYDFNQTILAIAHIRNCVMFNKKFTTLMRKLVAFHIYFRLDTHLLRHRLELRNAYSQFEERLSNCEKLYNFRSLSGNGKKNTSDTSEVHAAIVGQNIAQLATKTNFLINLDQVTYPVFNITYYFDINFLLYQNEFNKNSEKTVLYLPTIFLENMQTIDHFARDGKFNLISHSRSRHAKVGSIVNLTQWLREGYQVDCKNLYFREHLMELLNNPNTFLATKYFPLLPERQNLGIVQSHNIRLHQMALKDFNYFIPGAVFVVRNYKEDIEHLRTNVTSIATEIFIQYIIMFDAGDNN